MIAKFGSRSKCGDENFMKKMLDEAINFAYNKNSALKWMFTTFRMYWVSIKEVYYLSLIHILFHPINPSGWHLFNAVLNAGACENRLIFLDVVDQM